MIARLIKVLEINYTSRNSIQRKCMHAFAHGWPSGFYRTPGIQIERHYLGKTENALSRLSESVAH